MKFTVFSALVSFGVLISGAAWAPPALANNCSKWTWDNENRFEMSLCERSSGGSGYYILHNLTDRTLSVCWTIHFQNGKSSKGCRSSLEPREDSSASCYNCAPRNGGGITGVDLRKIEER